MTITRQQAQDMAEAHAEGMHVELPREGCPECAGRDLRSYPQENVGDRIAGFASNPKWVREMRSS